MRLAKGVFDFLVLVALLVTAWIGYVHESYILPGSITPNDALGAITSTESAIIGMLGALSATLIAVALIASQLSGRRPYSRLVASFHGVDEWYPFAILLIALVATTITLATAQRIVANRLFWLFDVNVMLFLTALLAVPSLMLKNFQIFSPRLVAENALRPFGPRTVRRYGLSEVSVNADCSIAGYQLKQWGHRHNLSDPLGAFHDILMEAVSERERITMHLYLAALVRKVAHLSGVPFERRFALAAGPVTHWTPSSLRALSRIYRAILRENLVTAVQINIHALHYLVRRAARLKSEWQLDNHRQIWIINLADLILCLTKRKGSEPLIQLSIDAILRVCMDYTQVPVYGSFEPVLDLFYLARRLREREFNQAENRLIRVLAFLDLNTNYVTKSTITDWRVASSRLSPEELALFSSLRDDMIGKSLPDAFPDNLWKA